MDVCQIVPYVSYPPRMGGDHRSHGLVKEFPSEGSSVTRFCQGGSPAKYRSLDLRRRVRIDNRYEERRHLNPLHEAVKAPMLLGYPNLLASSSLRFASDGLDGLIEDADVVVVREPWQMTYVLDNTPVETPVVFSSHNVETERFGDISQPAFEEWVKQRVDELERRAVERTDAIICTSERDADVYREQYDPGGPIFVAPNGTYEDDVRPHHPESAAALECRATYGIAEEATVCVFMGSNYKPNVEAAEAIVSIAEEMTDRSPPIHFLVLGTVGKSIQSANAPENLTVTGYIEDGFEAHLDASDIALNPMQSGGGTNIKLLDYFARSLPAISTPFGARGVDATDGTELVVAKLSEFPDAIETLAFDEEKRRRIGRAARRLTAEQYTWESASRHVHGKLTALFGPFCD